MPNLFIIFVCTKILLLGEKNSCLHGCVHYYVLKKCLLVFFFLLEGKYCNIFITTKMSQFSHLPRSLFLLHPGGFSFNRDDTTQFVRKSLFQLVEFMPVQQSHTHPSLTRRLDHPISLNLRGATGDVTRAKNVYPERRQYIIIFLFSKRKNKCVFFFSQWPSIGGYHMMDPNGHVSSHFCVLGCRGWC